MSTRYLESLFNPSSIVVIGASERADNLGGMVLRNLLGGGYPGRLLVVNQSGYDNVHGVHCVPRVSKMEFTPELAIICTPPDTVPKLVKKLGELGVRHRGAGEAGQHAREQRGALDRLAVDVPA